MRFPTKALAPLLLVSLLLPVAACGKKDRPRTTEAPARVTTIGINSYLWRATLETLSFMALAQVDSNGGVIITDWYASPITPNERVKVNVTVLDAELRADAIRVNAVRQTLGAAGWTDAPVRAGTVQKLEETILAKARDLRRAQMIDR